MNVTDLESILLTISELVRYKFVVMLTMQSLKK